MATNPRIDLTEEAHAIIKKEATKRGTSIRGFTSNLITGLNFTDSEIKVILSVPKGLTKNNKEGLREWLDARMNALMKTYYEE